MSRQYLQIPGPTNIPETIRQAMSKPAINHRGVEFTALLTEINAGLKYVFQSTEDILIFPSSGSGGLEAAIVNMFSPNDKVIGVNMGVFSQRFGQIAASFGLDVQWLEVEWGQALDPEQLREALIADTNKEIKGILLTQSETSTAVLNNIPLLQQAIKQADHPALVLVDAVSSIAISELATSWLQLDVVITGSQKGLMLPGGLSLISVSKRAWQANEHAKLPRWYWDFRPLRERMKQGRMIYTPAIAHFFGLAEALRLIQAEGLQNVLRRHRRNAQAIWAGAEALGLELFVPIPESRSDAVTAIKLPKNVGYENLARALEDLNIIIGGGLQHLQGKIFRIGHLGMLHEPEVLAILGGLELALKRCGYTFPFGAGTAAALEFYHRKTKLPTEE